MIHPTREEWMSYLCGEANAAERTTLDAHLQSCAHCAAQVADWRAARNTLDAWKLPARRARVTPARPVLTWAAAAAVVALSIGFGFGRFTSAAVDAAKVRAAIEPGFRRELAAAKTELQQEFAQQLRAELDKAATVTLAAADGQTRDLLADYARISEARRADDSQALNAALSRLESQRAADFLLLKKDLDTVAVNTDAGLRHTEQQLIQLADYTQPASAYPIQK